MKWQVAAVALICGLMLFDTSVYTARHPIPTNEPAARLLAAVRDHHLERGNSHSAAQRSSGISLEALARSEKDDALVRPNLDFELRP